MTIREAVEKHPSAKAAAIAKMIWKEKSPAVIIPLIERAVDQEQRAASHKQELVYIRPFLNSLNGEITRNEVIEIPEKVIAAFRRPVSLGNGIDQELWGLTREEHLARITMLGKQAEGIGETIDMHKRCIEIIDATGACTVEEALNAKVA